MKKLAYIILVIAILVLISHFVKQGNVTAPAATTEIPVVEVTETTAAVAEVAAPTTTPAEDNDVVDVQEVTEDVIVEDSAPTSANDGAVEVEEINPAQTANEDETVVKE